MTPAEIRQKALRAYPHYLAALVREQPFFPRGIRFGTLRPGGDYQAFSQLREALLQASKERRGRGYTVVLEPHDLRRYGVQMLPTRVFFETEEDYLSFLGKEREAEQFKSALADTRAEMPALLPWLAEHPSRALPYLAVWKELLDVCAYFKAHPRPNCYARELPLPVHTKFVEEHVGVLRSLLDAALPEDAITAKEPDFARRYGLRYDEPLLRLRLLDERLRSSLGFPVNDLSTPVSEFQALNLCGTRLVVVENKMTFLTLPPLAGSIALWGGGFKVEVLRPIDWLTRLDLMYWGDLDAHGFMILSQLRSAFPHAQSLMMDQETFDAFRSFAVNGTPTSTRQLPHLSPDEHRLFTYLASENLRLEQERIPHAHVVRTLTSLSPQASTPLP